MRAYVTSESQSPYEHKTDASKGSSFVIFIGFVCGGGMERRKQKSPLATIRNAIRNKHLS